MKALFATLVLSSLLAPMLPAQEGAAPAAKEEPAAPAPATAEPVPPITAEPTAATSTSDLTPAKEEPLPIPERSMELLPSADPGPTQILPEPVLIPETPEMIEKPEGTAIVPPGATAPDGPIKRSKTEVFADELALKVRYRQVKTRAMADPAVQAEFNNAQRARTDAQKRAALKRYYQLLYSRMAKIDKTLKKEINEREQISVRRLQQRRIDPTVTGDPEDSEPRVQVKSEELETRFQIGND